MFCDEKSQFPSIRFTEFTNAWEQEKLGNLKFDNGIHGGKSDLWQYGKILYID
ncbi:hypothetical protein HYE08_01155 [Mycoplasmopsis bovis]|nr:hypothetical protein [Mycoplasmopsis bovis]QQH27022.1 hypothetical protein HYE08_01155 [Mycoplasmopsis bovis]